MQPTALQQAALLAQMNREVDDSDELVVFAPEDEIEDELSLAMDTGAESDIWDASSVRRLRDQSAGEH